MRPKESLHIQFREVARPITAPETKFGGAPVWIDTPPWPLSAWSGKPMQFIGQVALDQRVFPGAVAKMAYVFMSFDPLEYTDFTWDPDKGENAVILQPGGSPHVRCAPLTSGPAIGTRARDPVTGRPVMKPIELACNLTPQAEPPYASPKERERWSEQQLSAYDKALRGNKIGGTPMFIQDDDLQFEDWRLLLQLGSGGVPFFVGFGDAGVGYAIANADCTDAKFLWQSH